MQKGDRIFVTIKGRRLEGVVELASNNDRSLAVLFDEGVPEPFGIFNEWQVLLLLKTGDAWHDIYAGRPVEVEM
jgi:hypothetical protein